MRRVKSFPYAGKYVTRTPAHIDSVKCRRMQVQELEVGQISGPLQISWRRLSTVSGSLSYEIYDGKLNRQIEMSEVRM